MLKVLAIVDKMDTAIDRLAQALKPYMTNLDYSVVDVHPKRPDDRQLANFETQAMAADIISFDYFRTAEMLLQRYPWLNDKKKILNHYNPYSITESNWDQYDRVTAPNESICKDLVKIMHNPEKRLKYIPLATDPYFWRFNFDWVPGKRVLMVANRIESKKGILEVAIACGELGLTFVLVGAVSDRDYMYSIMQTGAVEFHEQISDEELRDLYYGATVHVCNSKDDFESGTMPILEAMQCGTPVLTRRVGHVPDLDNGDNLKIMDCDNGDVIEITRQLENMINDKKALEEQRQAGWKTAKDYNPERRAYSLQRLYRSLLPGETVSVVVPVYDKPETIRACLNAIAEQDYPNIELIVVDDNPESNQEVINDFRTMVSFPVSYIYCGLDSGDYGLARARNLGIIQATGDIMVFCDQRMIMAPSAVTEFVNNLAEKTWVYGNKGGNKQNFVENFSAVARSEIIEAGMFNERCTKYGALSQEIRNRIRAQGFRHQYVESARATPMGKSGNRNQKKMDIIESKNWLWRVGL